MLDFLRRSANSIVMKALLVLLMLSFGAWGIGDVFRSGGNANSVATVGETEIPLQQFRAEFAREVDRLRQNLGPQMTREQALAMGLDGVVLERMVNMQLFQVAALDLGLMASDAVVANDIKATQDFFNASGQFDRRVYQSLLSRAGMSEDAYVARVRQGIIRQQYLSPISQGTTVPRPMADVLFERLSETRVLDVVRISHSQIEDVAEPTQSDLATYHEEHRQQFMAPEYRGLTAVVLSTEDVAQSIDVSDEELQAAYDARADQYMTPETRRIEQVLVKDEATAQQAAELLDGGATPEAAAAQVGANTSMVNLGVFTKSDAAQLSTAIADAVFSTPAGERTEPIKSPLGWHVLKVTDVEQGTAKSLDDVREALLADVRRERALDVLFELSNEMDDLLAQGQTLEEAARTLNVEVHRTPAVDQRGRTPTGEDAELPYARDLIAKGFELNEGRESLLSETQDGQAFFVVRVDGVTPPALRPLAEVEKAVKALWQAERRAEKAAQLAAQVEDRLKTGQDAAQVAQDIAGQAGAAFTTDAFNRTGEGLEQGALPATLVERAFSLQLGGVARAEGTNAHTVARLKTVTEAQVDRDAPLYNTIEQRTRQALQGDLLDQLSRALQARYPVEVNQTALQGLSN